jgi:hypothetical protein
LMASRLAVGRIANPSYEVIRSTKTHWMASRLAVGRIANPSYDEVLSGLSRSNEFFDR